MANGQVIWITGLSGAGKTSLANEMAKILREQTGNVLCLDGDDLRSIFFQRKETDNVYEIESRMELALKYSRLAKLLSEQGLIIIVSTISMFHEVQKWNRENIQGYFEIYLKVPLDVLVSRDPKQIYRRYFDGKLSNVAGLDLPVEEPQNPDAVVEYSANKSAKEIAFELVRLKG